MMRYITNFTQVVVLTLLASACQKRPPASTPSPVAIPGVAREPEIATPEDIDLTGMTIPEKTIYDAHLATLKSSVAYVSFSTADQRSWKRTFDLTASLALKEPEGSASRALILSSFLPRVIASGSAGNASALYAATNSVYSSINAIQSSVGSAIARNSLLNFVAAAPLADISAFTAASQEASSISGAVRSLTVSQQDSLTLSFVAAPASADRAAITSIVTKASVAKTELDRLNMISFASGFADVPLVNQPTLSTMMASVASAGDSRQIATRLAQSLTLLPIPPVGTTPSLAQRLVTEVLDPNSTVSLPGVGFPRVAPTATPSSVVGCNVVGPFGSIALAHLGSSTVSGFASASVPFGSACQGRSVTYSCTNGIVSSAGVIPAVASCSAAPGAVCSATIAPWGQVSLAHNATQNFNYYAAASYPFGSQAPAALIASLSCSNGTVTGVPAGSRFATIVETTPNNCSVAGPFSNFPLTHGVSASVTGFAAATVPFGASCQSQTALYSCTNGVVTSGGILPSVASCSVTPGAACSATVAPWGQVDIAHAASRNYNYYTSATYPFAAEAPAPLTASLSCSNGEISGAPTGTIFASTSEMAPSACSVQSPLGGTLSISHNDSQTVSGFASAVSAQYNQACQSQNISYACSNGVVTTSGNSPAVAFCSLAADRAPTWSNTTNVTVNEGQTLDVDLSTRASDADGDVVIFSCLSGCNAFIAVQGASLTLYPNFIAAGTYSLSLRATANGISADASVSVVVADVSVPLATAPSVSSQSLFTSVKRPVWNWTPGTGGDGSFRLVVDGESPVIQSDLSFTPASDLADGVHTVLVQERNAGGDYGAAGSYSLTVDTIAPLVSIGVPNKLLINASSAVSFPIAILNAANIIASPENFVLVNKIGVTGCNLIVSGLGVSSRTVTLSGCMGNGSVSISALADFASDEAGNRSAGVAPGMTVTVDNLAPVVAFTSPANGSAFNSNFILAGTCESGLLVTLTGVTPISTSCAAGIFSQTVAMAGSDGSKTISVSQTDAAGNAGIATTGVVRDTTNPIVTITAPATNSFVKATAVTVSGSCSENGVAVNVVGSGVLTGANPICTAGTYSASITLTSSDGVKAIAVSQTDAATNVGNASVNITLDTISPILTIVAPAASSFANSTTVTVSGACSENGRAVAIAGSGVQTGATPNCASGSYSASITLTTGDGSKAISASQSDAATNVGNASVSISLDSVVPVVSIISPAVSSLMTSTALTVSGACSENGRVVTIAGSGVQTGATPVCASGAYSANITLTTGDGIKAISVSQSDVATNSGNTSVSITLDTTAPVVTIVSPAASSVVNATTVTVSGTCSENGRVVTIAGSGVQTGGSPICSLATYSSSVALTSGDGTKTISVSQTDAAGNTSSLTTATISLAPANCQVNGPFGSFTVLHNNSSTVSGFASASTVYPATCQARSVSYQCFNGAVTTVGTVPVSQTCFQNPAPLAANISAPIISDIGRTVALASWPAATNATDYRVLFNASASAPVDCNTGNAQFFIDVSSPSYAFTARTPGTMHSFRICSLNVQGVLSSGTTGSFTTTAEPNDVASLFVASRTTTSLSVIGTDSTPSIGSANAISYKLSYRSGAIAPFDCSGTSVSSSTLNFTISGLAVNSTYSMRLCKVQGALALNDTVYTSPGAALSGQKTNELPPTAMTSIESLNTFGTTAQYSTTLSGTWRSEFRATVRFTAGTAPNIKYLLGSPLAPTVCSGTTGSGGVISTSQVLNGGSAVSNTVVFASLTPGQQYGILACSFNGNTPPDYSSLSITRTMPFPPPTVATGTPVINNDLSTSIPLTLTAPSGYSPAGYRIYMSDVSSTFTIGDELLIQSTLSSNPSLVVPASFAAGSLLYVRVSSLLPSSITGQDLYGTSSSLSAGVSFTLPTPANCSGTILGSIRNINHGLSQAITAYSASQAPFGSTCQAISSTVTATCNNGTITTSPSSLTSLVGSCSGVKQLTFFNAVVDSGTFFNQPMVSDGTSAGTLPLRPTNAVAPTVDANPRYFKQLLGKVYYAATSVLNGATQAEVWVYNPVLPISTTNPSVAFDNAGTTSSSPLMLTSYNNKLYFQAAGTNTGTEMWVYDPSVAVSAAPYTAATNPKLIDINTTTTTASSNASHFHIFNNKLYFVATDGVSGGEMWVYDDSLAISVGTNPRMVADLRSGSGSGFFTYQGTDNDNMPQFTTMNNELFFVAYNDASIGFHLSKMSTSETISLVKNHIGTTGNDLLSGMIAYNNKLYYKAQGATTPTNVGAELWVSDGTTVGTTMIDIAPTTTTAATGSSPYSFFPGPSGKVYFVANNAASGSNCELFSTDGITATLVKDLNGTSAGISCYSSNDRSTRSPRMVYFNNLLYFEGMDTGIGTELFQSDGTNAGTTLSGLGDYNIGTSSGILASRPLVYSGNPYSIFTVVNNVLLLSAASTGSNYELQGFTSAPSLTPAFAKELLSGTSGAYPFGFNTLQ